MHTNLKKLLFKVIHRHIYSVAEMRGMPKDVPRVHIWLELYNWRPAAPEFRKWMYARTK